MTFFAKHSYAYLLFILLILFSPLRSFAQERENCSIDTTRTIDVNKVLNTLSERIKLSAYAQAGFNYYSQQSPKDEFKVARIVFMADARINKQLSMYFMFDFKASNLLELNCTYSPSAAFNVKVGQFKTPFTIENMMSPTVLELVYCSSLATGYMIGGSDALMMKGCGGRDLGVQIYGSLLKKKLEYSVALMNGSGRNNTDGNSQKDFVSKLTVHPAKWLTLSSSMILGKGNATIEESSATPGTYICATAPGITGFKSNGNFTRNRYAAGLCLDFEHLGLRSEYMQGKDGDFVSKGYYATACIKRIAPNFDAVLSYDWLTIYSGKKNRYVAGLQYWFYPKCRFQVNYGYETSDTSRSQNVIQTQVQVRF
jgi:hypothetical protein